MKYFEVDIDWNASLDSPWDAVWPKDDDSNIDCLDGSLPLLYIWNQPPVTIERRDQTPDIFGFVLHWAVTEHVKAALEPLVGLEAEFLPLSCADAALFVVHPLWPIDFDDDADLHRNSVSNNVTVVKKYSFSINPDEFNGPRHLFRMLQPERSSARKGGYTLKRLIMSEKCVEILEEIHVKGVRFRHIHTVET
ncbi:MAG: hypothetical protein ACK6DS_19950 [Planctomycetota bacterium]